ncbi:MAG: PilT protein domain protein [Naasia sp.]|nr:PilT protein domain protein [Naasia sp.]
MIVLDASAVLAFLAGESGADEVEANLTEGTVCPAVNWSEVAQKVRTRGADWLAAKALIESYGVRVEPTTAADAELAATLWQRGSGLSLADRLCLATGRRLGGTVLTADAAWGGQPGVQLIQASRTRGNSLGAPKLTQRRPPSAVPVY